jgi:RND family efflux transporter MFP subunit
MSIQTNTTMTSPAVERGQPVIAVRRGASRTVWIVVGFLAVVLLVVIVLGILSRSAAEHSLKQKTVTDSVLNVVVTHPVVTSTSPEIALPGNTQAYVDTPIYARTNGYLRKWFFDIGAHVKKGQLMATIETPEVDQQLQVAEADLKSSQANLNLAKTTSQRYTNLLKLDSVSKQETDQAVSDEAAKSAAVQASEAAVRRLQQLQSFERIYAPFDGIVTARNTDIGALIDAGSGSAQPRDLFRLASTGLIRVFVPVPEAYAPDITDGGKAYLTLDEFPNKRFEGTITRNSSAIDPLSRTLNVEVDVPNAQGLVLPGAYVFVHFTTPVHADTVSIPANTLLFRAQGLQVGVVREGHVHLLPVTIAHDSGATVEIRSGLSPSDRIILDPSDSLAEGQEVHVTEKSKAGAQ